MDRLGSQKHKRNQNFYEIKGFMSLYYPTSNEYLQYVHTNLDIYNNKQKHVLNKEKYQMQQFDS